MEWPVRTTQRTTLLPSRFSMEHGPTPLASDRAAGSLIPNGIKVAEPQPFSSYPADVLLAAIVDSSDDAIISLTLDGTIISWNRAAQRMYGYTPQDIVGRSVLTLIPPELHEDEGRIIARVGGGERIEHYDTTRRRKDGALIDVSLTISPIRAPAGEIVGASKVARDVTRQRKADDAMRLLAAIVDSSDDAIISKNLKGIITSWNSGAERIFGYTAEEMIGRPVTTLIPPERLDEEPRIIERLQRGERVDHYQTVRVRKGGEYFDVSLTISPIRDANGVVVGASKVARDITHEKRAMAQIALANEALKRADRMKSEFLAIMSHELRTPLNSIIGFASVLRRGHSGPLTADQMKQLTLIHDSGKHLLHLINDMLDVSRIESGRMEVECEEFSPAEVIAEAVQSLTVQAQQKQLEVITELGEVGSAYSDRRRFLQVVLNLINNAIKFTPRGQVGVRMRRDGRDLVVAVRDTGIGIAPDKQGELFQPFRQLEGSARRRYEGTGLGLYLCRKLVHLLGGEITVRSEVGRGSEFTFRIPLRFEPAAGHQTAA